MNESPLRKGPLNYIITLACAGIVVAAAASVVGGLLGEWLDLQNRTVEEFLSIWRSVVMTAGTLVVLATWYWFYYGSRPRAATETKHARTIWMTLFFIEVFIGAIAFAVLMFLFHGPASAYGLFLIVSICTSFVFFWIISLLMSPRNVMYVPLGRR